jgi:hypothetical protein
VGFTFLFQKYKGNKAEGTPTATTTIARADLYGIDESQVKEVLISDSAGGQIDLYLNPADSNWVVKDIPSDQSDSVQIKTILSQLFTVQILDTFTENPSLDTVGLATPAYKITFILNDGTQLVTNVGSVTAIGNGYYVRVGDGQVVIVEKTPLDDASRLVSTPPLLATATPEGGTPSQNASEATSTP